MMMLMRAIGVCRDDVAKVKNKFFSFYFIFGERGTKAHMVFVVCLL